jgi:hypothetical protein
MANEPLIQQVNSLLTDSPLEDEFVEYWQERLPQMNEQQLAGLLKLLQDRLAILNNSNQLLVQMAEDADVYNQQTIGVVEPEMTFLDMPIATIAGLFKERLVAILTDQDFDIFEDLDEYFLQENVLKADLPSEFKMLADALLDNHEILLPDQPTIKATVGVWLHDYLVFSSDQAGVGSDRGDYSLRRLNFVSQNETAKKLPEAEKNLLLKLLKLYDYFREATVTAMEDRQEQQTRAEEDLAQLKQRRTVAIAPAGAGQPSPAIPPVSKKQAQIEELETMAVRYPAGSLERLALEEELDKLRKII